MDKFDTHPQKTSLFSVKTFGMCLVAVVIVFFAVTIFKIPISTVGYAAILLACPLLHVWMMKDGVHKH